MTSSAKRRAFWRADWFAAALVIAAVLLLHAGSDFTRALERRFYDWASTQTDRQPFPDIAIIAVDDQSIANLGRWPWPRDLHAKLIDLLAAAQARTIAYTVFFFEPQTDRGLAFIRKMKDVLAPAEVAAGDAQPAQSVAHQLSQVIAEAESALDTDAQLADSMQRAGNVIVPSAFVLGQPLGRPDKPLPPYASRSAIEDLADYSVPATSSQQPIESIGKAAAGVAHLTQLPDVDGAVREEPLLIKYDGLAVPSIALLAAAHSLNLRPNEMRPVAGDALQVGGLLLRTDSAAVLRPQFYRRVDGRPPFTIDSFYDVLNGKIAPAKYAGKIVLIGATAAGVGTQFPVPGGQTLTPVETVAHIISSIRQGHFFVQPGWGGYAAAGAFLLIGVYLLVVLPRLSAGVGAIATLVLFLGLLGAEFGLLSRAATWLQLVLPATLLLAGHLALTTKRFLVTEAGKQQSDQESAETNRMMGLALQGQGQFDMAFDRFRRVPPSDALMDNLYSLALDFERKRQFNKAQSVYEHILRHAPKFKDVRAKYKQARSLSETVVLSGARSGATLLQDGQVEKPMLGRYQVEKELGKGAMGVVYMGRDPKIGRVVAIKTMALGEEFEGEELVDARARFFREAETAGRLQHQNIVTIFDAGEEHDLAYIAMEFLKGRDLTEHSREGSLLPVPQVVSIIARVAEALDYAHQQNVVHRDIKPANIMFDAATDTVKVTDFGIARITDASRTRTGLVLGTPSFMSPEQLAGKRVDGRSDLYSLGVTLFQMLTGALPLRGDSMTELMYKIANEDPPDVRQLRAGLPAQLAAVVAFSLRKQPEARYQSGRAFAAELRRAAPDGAAATAAKGGLDYDAQPLHTEQVADFQKTIVEVRPPDLPPPGDTGPR
ncbi:serine/threonine-protein kinase [Ramlibacter sp. H39-3-26]|uniref:CHASE2 domain-containing serine/threonine-protein kinase n=1 Tax=Curvibacter soli TaxID=3031331 RepID=UPI0023DACBE5|nr:serine/threonine-protein kinase [Ramlibacter sp. H39-3-26]MDF1485202.1 serine/threonine-protein kinase [Ramlibacter sp. H39-3-26]